MVDVLIVSSLSERYYYDAFVRASEAAGVSVGILDPEHFIRANASLHVQMGSRGFSGFVELVQLGDDTNVPIRVPLEKIRVGWHLRVNRTRRVADIEDVAERFKWNESLYALEALSSLLSCRWVNTFEAIDRLTCNKLLQQKHAARAGLSVPETVVSNIPDRVSQFSRQHAGRLLTKSIGYVLLDPSDELVLYSELFETAELEQSAAAIRACPLYVQEYIPKKYEYRVMVIGEKVLACRIDSQASPQTRVDWRHYDFEHVEHVAAVLPREVEEKLRFFMRSVGLSYGAIDLIETPSGEWVFLEVNPSGQWDWIAKLAGLPIPDTVAQMLKAMR